MRFKRPLIMVLTLVLCLALAMGAGAMNLSAKDALIGKIKVFDLGINPEFYNKSRGESNLEVEKFAGALAQGMPDFTGSKVDFIYYLDEPNKTMKLNLLTDFLGKQHSTDMYITEDKLILERALFDIVQQYLAPDQPMPFEPSTEYLYLPTKEMTSMWEQMQSYKQQTLPKEYIELMLFMIEAVPEQYFSIKGGHIIIELDQQGFEDTLINLLTKLEKETNRFVDILVKMNGTAFEEMGVSEEELRQEIINSISGMPKEEIIREVSTYVTIEKLYYQTPILPGGNSEFNLLVSYSDAEEMNLGSVEFVITADGAPENRSSDLNFTVCHKNIPSNLEVNFAWVQEYQYDDKQGTGKDKISVQAYETANNMAMLDVVVNINSVAEIDPHISLSAPQLTEENSLDLNELILTAIVEEIAAEDELILVVNGDIMITDINPYIKDNRTVAPVRFVAEELGGAVDWVEPNRVCITKGDKVIQMHIGENSFKVNGEDKSLDVVPFIEDGRTMVPVRFVAEQLGATVEMIGNQVHINY
ncbi:copper amine oxidase N-terminal domain-containing protein [Desulfofalx alkaliphila]|uniref:copper amine oxidase N-terminal domain-containing protein n=1 Tax=Desulfofalx alkaliphila TaxID=105483 RepID=UPI00068A9B8C|nr:copper amine oxidase N-terminal domain-containing protein [Desulfofalx alkaliphila]